MSVIFLGNILLFASSYHHIIISLQAGISTKVSSVGEGMSRERSMKRDRMSARHNPGEKKEGVAEEKAKVKGVAEEVVKVEAAAEKTPLKRTMDNSFTEAQDGSLEKKFKIECKTEEQRNVDAHTPSNETKLSTHQIKEQTERAETIEKLQKSNNTVVHTSQEAGGLVTVTERQDDSALKACDASVCDTVITGSTGNNSLVNEVVSHVTHSPSNAQSESKLDNLPYTSITNVDNTEKRSATLEHHFQAVTPPGSSTCQVNVTDTSLSKKDDESCTVCNVRTLPSEDDFTVIDSCKSRKSEGIDTGPDSVKNNRHSLEKKASVCNDIKAVDKEIPGAMVNSEVLAGLSKCISPRNENLDCTVATSPLKRKKVDAEEKDNNICEDRNNKQPRFENQ